MLRGGGALAVAGVAVAASLTGCSSSGGGSSSNATVTVWSWRSQDKPLWDTVAKDTGVKINFRSVTATSYDSVLQTAMNGGSGPDIFYDRAGSGTMTYGAAGPRRRSTTS
jgi:multiple sugar transport system substrate-binding protein/raffinose/stachyose/melibiose transport system substrate-binding protein